MEKSPIQKKKNPYNTAIPFVADRELLGPIKSYAGGTSPLTLSCPETNLSYNELDLIIASLRRGCLKDAIVGGDTTFTELVSAVDAPESDEWLETTVSVDLLPPGLLGFRYDEVRHGQFGIKEIELSKTSEYRGRLVHSGLHRHYNSFV